MGVIDPAWYAQRTPEEIGALREAFSEKTASELDVGVNSVAALKVLEFLLRSVMAMDGHNVQSLRYIEQAISAFGVAGKVALAISTDEVVKSIWPEATKAAEVEWEGDPNE
jgi:hypothetical protein